MAWHDGVRFGPHRLFAIRGPVVTQTFERIFGFFAAGLAVLILTGQAIAQDGAAPAATKVVATHGDWQVRCNQDESVCVMAQVGKDPSGKDLAEVQIRKLEGATLPDGTAVPAAIQIVTPLGVLLPAGLQLKVDAKAERPLRYELCSQGGCLVRQPLDATLLGEMKGGNVARLTMLAPQQQEIATDISLSGFTKAFDALK